MKPNRKIRQARARFASNGWVRKPKRTSIYIDRFLAAEELAKLFGELICMRQSKRVTIDWYSEQDFGE